MGKSFDNDMHFAMFEDLLSIYKNEHQKNEQKAEKDQAGYVDDYIVKLIKMTESLSRYVKKHPDQAYDVLQCASLIVQEGYPTQYKDMDYDKFAYYDAAHDFGLENNSSEVDLSSHLRGL